MLTLRQSVYSSRRTNILPLCEPTTTTYSLNSFRYFASKKWNSLPNNVRSEPTLSGFRRLLKAISRGTQRGYSSKPLNMALLNVF